MFHLVQRQMNNSLLLVWSALLASSFYFSAEVVAFAPPVINTWIRFVIAAVFLFPLVAKQIKPFLRWRIVKKVLLATCCLVAFFLLFFKSLEHTSAFNTSVIYTLLPIFTLLLWAVFSKSASLWQQLPAFMLGSAGAVLLLWIVRPAGVNGWYWNWGDALFFLATLMLAAHVVLMQKQSESVPPMVGTFLVLACGSVLLTPFAFLHPGSLPGPSQGQYWLLILWLAIFTTLVTVLLQQFLVKRVGSSHFIAYSYLIPVLVAVMAGTLNSSNIVLSIPGLIMIIMALAKITGFSKKLNGRNLAEARKHCGSV